MILAIPVFFINLVILACILKLVFGYDSMELSWPAALLLGTIVSITDACEVVEVIEKLGLSHKFKTLCELEALLNDGTGIIFFILFSDMADLTHPA